MKNLSFILLLSLISLSFLQAQDSIISNYNDILITQNTKTKLYTFKTKGKTVKDLKFIRFVYQAYQVLDTDNNLFFLDSKGKKMKEFQDFLGLCGTVPHYELTVEEDKKNFVLYTDEQFYDHDNKIPKEKFMTISKKDADEVLFINGKNKFNYSSNFTAGICLINPEQVILKKDGKFFTPKHPKKKYDEIDHSNYYDALLVRSGDLWGVLGITEAKYKSVEAFEYYLAKATLPNGEEIFIDIDGNEY